MKSTWKLESTRTQGSLLPMTIAVLLGVLCWASDGVSDVEEVMCDVAATGVSILLLADAVAVPALVVVVVAAARAAGEATGGDIALVLPGLARDVVPLLGRVLITLTAVVTLQLVVVGGKLFFCNTVAKTTPELCSLLVAAAAAERSVVVVCALVLRDRDTVTDDADDGTTLEPYMKQETVFSNFWNLFGKIW